MKKYTAKISEIFRSISLKVWVLIVFSFLLGFLFRSPGQGSSEHESHSTSEHQQAETWTCSMHPQIKLSEPGQCPICFMDLIPLDNTEGKGLDRDQLKLSEAAMKLAEIETATAVRRKATAEVRLSGKIEYDETQIKTITSWVPGRLERLFVDYTGVRIEKDDHLVEIYSPNLYAAQEELVQAVKYAKNASDLSIETSRATLAAAREKLARLGLSADQINEIETTATPSPILTILSPMEGIVITKNAVEGLYVNTGTPIYRIANLDHVWAKLDAYESDLPFLTFGQTVEFEVEALPGEIFYGKVAFVDPVLDEKTRTVHIRMNIENPDYKLKPGMFVRALVKAELDAKGKVVHTDLAGKWISPMHPEIVKDGPGSCDICGMDLVRAEELGVVKPSSSNLDPLQIPASAVLATGKRAIVYVKTVNDGNHLFEGREVLLGPRAGDYYIILGGLREGEEVVKQGNFKIDSAMQIAAKKSMMNEEKRPLTKEISLSIDQKEILSAVIVQILELSASLAGDNLESSKKTAGKIHDLLGGKLDLKGDVAKSIKVLDNASIAMLNAGSIESFRQHFESISNGAMALLHDFPELSSRPIYEVFCPMAFNNTGASWLQDNKTVNNPYFGSSMLRCGSVKRMVNSY